MFEDTKGVIRRSHAKKNRKYNDQTKRTKRFEGIYFCPKRKLKPHLNFKLIVMGM
jgi:hypothetical protein